jgi:hypothetical protein
MHFYDIKFWQKGETAKNQNTAIFALILPKKAKSLRIHFSVFDNIAENDPIY